MKKVVIIFGIVLIVLVAIVIGVVTMLNREKQPITAEEFRASMQEKGYRIGEATSQFKQYNYVTKVYIAASTDGSHQIEFYELSDEQYANMFYNNNKTIFEQSKGNSGVTTAVSGKNYAKYTQTANNKYSVVSKIGNTVTYLNVDSTYETAVKKILKEIGY